jgi:hypothetical protein
MCSRFLIPLLMAATLLLSACSSIEYTPDQAPRMVVLHDGVPFFLHGPAQGNGADRTLAKGDEVQVLRKDFGYSFVQLEDGQKGFVANEELVTAPPRPSPTPSQASNPVSDAPPSLWPQEKTVPDLPASAPDSNNAPLPPPGFRY